jgi:hypothetical protein
MNAKKILNIPDDIDDLVKHQVSFFRKFTPQYIYDHYKVGVADMVVHFYKDEIRLVKNSEAIKNRFSVDHRSKVIATIIKNLYNNQDYKKIIDNLNLTVPFCFSDTPDNKLQNIPCLTFSKNSFSNNILIPSLNSIIDYVEYEHVDYTDRPLLHKKEKMCFVGSLTNIGWNGYGIQANQRLQIASMAEQNPDSWFCKILRPPKFEDKEWDDVVKEVESNFPAILESGHFCNTSEKISISDQLRYKYQVCIDGHTCAWARLPWQMKSNSVVFKIKNNKDNFVEWFYPLLESSKHFLELETHYVMDAYEHMIHDVEYQQYICSNASDFVNKYLNSDISKRILLYTLHLLNEEQNIKDKQ